MYELSLLLVAPRVFSDSPAFLPSQTPTFQMLIQSENSGRRAVTRICHCSVNHIITLSCSYQKLFQSFAASRKVEGTTQTEQSAEYQAEESTG